MYDFISLKVKCPECDTFLNDNEVLVDNEESIKLNVHVGKNTGTIRLSSIYGSYNHVTDIDIPSGQLAEFSCPHCNKKITSEAECPSCHAHMIPLEIDIGGLVSFCSRSGCKNHLVEFEDLAVALKKMQHAYSQKNRKVPDDLLVFEEEVTELTPTQETKEILKTGTFLRTFCPKCRKSLIRNQMVVLKIDNGEKGILMLSPYLNVFTSRSTIFLPENKTVSDIRCFHCEESLIDTETSCGACASPVAKISISASTKFIDFYICSKKGCRWHGLSQEDIMDIELEDSLEW